MENLKNEQQDKLHASVMLYMAAKAEKDSAEARMASHKIQVEKHLAALGETEILLPYDEISNVKVKSTIRLQKKFDKEQAAEDLNVAESSLKQDFFIKAVEDQKLTYKQWTGYIYREENQSVSIRTVKA